MRKHTRQVTSEGQLARQAGDWRRPSAHSLLWQTQSAIAAPIIGIKIIARNRRMRWYALPTTLLGAAWGAFATLGAFAIPETGGWWQSALAVILEWSLAATILFIQIMIALLAPILDLLSEETEAAIGTLPPQPPLLRQIVTPAFWLQALGALLEAIKLLIFKLLLYGVSFLFVWIPAVGPYLAGLVAGIATGADFLDYPFARRYWTLRQKLQAIKPYWVAATVFGVMVYGLFEIPGLAGIMVAPCVVGGTLLLRHLELIEPENELSQSGANPPGGV